MTGLDQLLKEQPNPASGSIDSLPTAQVPRIIIAEEGRSVRTAIVMARAGVAREEAVRRVAAARGIVSKALNG